MLKLTGLLLLFSSCTLFGFRLSAQLTEREQAVAQMMDFWQQFALQLECLRSAPSQLVQTLTLQQSFCDDPFFISLNRSFVNGSFKVALQRAVQENPQLARWGITPVLLPLGDVIGVRELESQLAAIASVILTLKNLHGSAAAECEKKGELYRKLGVLAGIMLVVLLF